MILKNFDDISNILFFGILALNSGFNEEVFNFSPHENHLDAPVFNKKDKLNEE